MNLSCTMKTTSQRLLFLLFCVSMLLPGVGSGEGPKSDESGILLSAAPFEEPYPEELGETVWQRAFLRGQYYPYPREQRSVFGEVEEARLIWKEGDISVQSRITEITLQLESIRARGEGRREFSLTVVYPEDYRREGKVFVRHSSPWEKDLANGLIVRFSERTLRWGGYIFGRDVPGVLVFAARTTPGYMPPLLLCPRFASQERKSFRLHGRDPKLILKGVSAKVTADFSSHYLTGYGVGATRIQLFSLRADPPRAVEKYVVAHDVKTALSYTPSRAPAPELYPPESTRATPLGISGHFMLQNAAGRKKHAKLSHIVWVKERHIERSQEVQFYQSNKLRKTDLRPGLCLELLPVEYKRLFYTGGEGDTPSS
ncbi:hypothetical protein MRY87_07405 [bacterium]|nr:hypothetical protein [bacterium]